MNIKKEIEDLKNIECIECHYIMRFKYKGTYYEEKFRYSNKYVKHIGNTMEAIEMDVTEKIIKICIEKG